MAIPFYTLKIAFQIFFLLKHDHNPIANGKPLTGIKKGCISKEYSVSQLKEKCKEIKITFNDLLMTSVSMTLKKYFIQKGDEKTSKVLFYMPINFRERQEEFSKFEFCNKFATFPFELDLINDFNGHKLINRNLRYIRESFIVMGMFQLFRLVLQLPAQIA